MSRLCPSARPPARLSTKLQDFHRSPRAVHAVDEVDVPPPPWVYKPPAPSIEVTEDNHDLPG